MNSYDDRNRSQVLVGVRRRLVLGAAVGAVGATALPEISRRTTVAPLATSSATAPDRVRVATRAGAGQPFGGSR